MDLKDRVAIVTGSGRGIGRALAREFARHGAKVVCCARTQGEVLETASLIRQAGGQALAQAADVSDRSQVDRLVKRALDELGRIDILFNNAARIPVIAGLWEVDPDLWWEELAVDLRGPMLCSRAVLPHMMARNEGIIINMTGGTNIPGRTSYCCSKVAINRLTVLLAQELKRAGSSVIVFEMGPGLVKTRRTLHEAQSPEGRKWNPNTALNFEQGKDRPPEECARAAVKLIARAGPDMCGKTFQTAQVLAE